MKQIAAYTILLIGTVWVVSAIMMVAGSLRLLPFAAYFKAILLICALAIIIKALDWAISTVLDGKLAPKDD